MSKEILTRKEKLLLMQYFKLEKLSFSPGFITDIIFYYLLRKEKKTFGEKTFIKSPQVFSKYYFSLLLDFFNTLPKVFNYRDSDFIPWRKAVIKAREKPLLLFVPQNLADMGNEEYSLFDDAADQILVEIDDEEGFSLNNSELSLLQAEDKMEQVQSQLLKAQTLMNNAISTLNQISPLLKVFK